MSEPEKIEPENDAPTREQAAAIFAEAEARFAGGEGNLPPFCQACRSYHVPLAPCTPAPVYAKWSDGPPSSDVEAWRNHRRNEVLGASVSIVQGLIMARAKVAAQDGEPWEPKDSDDLAKIAEDAFEIAARLVDLADARVSRRSA